MPRPIRAIARTGALLLVLAACGGETATTTTPPLPTMSEQRADATTTTTAAVDPEEAFQEFTACMREHGINMPDPETEGGADGAVISIEGGGPMDPEAFEEAAAACDPILEAAFGEFELSPEQEAEMMDQQLAFAQCMRDNGVDWPDPSGDGGTMIELGDDISSETIHAAMEICREGTFGSSDGIMVEGEAP